TTGTREISVAGNYVFNGDKPYTLNVGYGYFLSPSIEVGGQAGVAGASGGGTFTSLGAIANYYIPIGGGTDTTTNALLPFVGAFLGYAHNGGSGNTGSSDTTSYGGQGGVKYFFNSNVALDLEYDYRTARHSNGLSSLNLGISTFFH
ncbi:MAG: outer membrane beta-barrel protein, partial [Armatimonadota bacterium]|nr:outer membrane beta-barrel protein [Armatimonadota bacterium]